jgi:transcriptional regulator with XRE-family HTH domain
MIQGHRLREARAQRALSQGALGKLVAKDGAYISKLERGVRVSVSTTTLERLVAALDTSADYLLGISDHPTPAAPAASWGKKSTAHGTPMAPAAEPTPPRSPGMCPHCGVPLQPLGDGARVGCPGRRHSVAKST